MAKAKKSGAGNPPPLDQAAIAAEFVRVTGRPEFDASMFAYHIGSLAREVAAPIYTVKERRARLRRLASALGRAAEELGMIDGVCVMRIAKEAASNVSRQVSELSAPKPWTYAHQTVASVAGAHYPRPGGKFAFGRHGLPKRPSIAKVDEYSTTLQGMVADLELLALASARAAKADISDPVDSRSLLAGALVETFTAFDMVATGSPDGLAAFCMTEILTARGDAGSGLDALQKAIARRNSENGSKI